jgi:hypothetical protein
MFHNEDIVEEIATGRQGKIDSIQSGGVLGQEQIQNQWRVVFLDGKEPPLKYFNKENEICLVKCPHSQGEPGFYPARPIMDPPY